MIPPIVQEIIGLIGEEAAYALVKARGGMAVYFPRSCALPPVLAGILSEDAWLTLCRRYGSSYIFLPKCHRAMLLRRNQRIRQARQAGQSIAELVGLFNLTDRQIITICGHLSPPEPLHMSLFSDEP